MKLFAHLFAIVIILSVGALMIIAGYYGISYMWDAYMELAYVVRVIITVGVTVILLGALIVTAGLRMGTRIRAKSQLSAVRLELYATVLDLYRTCMDGLHSGDTQKCDEALEQLSQLETDLVLVSDCRSLKAHQRLLEGIISFNQIEFKEVERRLVELIRGFRSDLGHSYAFEETFLGSMMLSEQSENGKIGPAVTLTAAGDTQ